MSAHFKMPELLAPAGSPEALKAALSAGADAVYIGGTQFNARMNAKNFDRNKIVEAVNCCHEAGARLYVTVNTMVFDREMNDALAFASFLYEAGVDALIVADIGFATELHRRIPDFSLHASTQMSGHNAHAAQFLKEAGFTRMVSARELSKENLKELIAHSPIEIESFVHGALCVSHSGQCLFSSIVGGRSGNRGECAQPCRLPYNGKYPLSLKDYCLAGHLTELVDLGVASLKIEGRMKSPEYVYSVVSTYKNLLLEHRNAGEKEIAEMAKVFSREGFTDGYFVNRISNTMLGVRTADAKRISDSLFQRKKPLVVQREKIETEEKKAPAFLPYKIQRMPPPPKAKKSARFYKASSIPDHLKGFEAVYLPLDRFDGKKANGVLFPPVITDTEYEKVREQLLLAKKKGAVHALLGNVGHIDLARECGFILHGDYRFNIGNSASAAFYEKIFEDVLLSPELILPQVRDIPGEKSLIVYGRIPLMTLEKPLGTEILTDRRRVRFPVLKEGGRDIVFNSLPIYMADRRSVLDGAQVKNSHYIFTTEGPKECETVISYYEKGYPTKREVRRIK